MTKYNLNIDNNSFAVSSKSYVKACVVASVCSLAIINPVYADWFQVDQVKGNLITPIYNLVDENLGIMAFAMGGMGLVLTRGMDMWQKALAFGAGSLGTAGSVKLAKTVLHFG